MVKKPQKRFFSIVRDFYLVLILGCKKYLGWLSTGSLSRMYVVGLFTFPSRLLVFQIFGLEEPPECKSSAALEMVWTDSVGSRPAHSSTGVSAFRCSYLLSAEGFICCHELNGVDLSPVYTELSNEVVISQIRHLQTTSGYYICCGNKDLNASSSTFRKAFQPTGFLKGHHNKLKVYAISNQCRSAVTACYGLSC